MNRPRRLKYRIFKFNTGLIIFKTRLVIDRSLKARNNLEILRPIGILPLTGNLDIPISSLLLRLSNGNPLLGREVLAKFGERVGCQTKPLEKGAVLNRIKDNVVVGAIFIRL